MPYSAPNLLSTLAQYMWPSAMASSKGVRPHRSLTLMSACAYMSNSTVMTFPSAAAEWMGYRPS